MSLHFQQISGIQTDSKITNISHYFNFITSLNDSNLTLLIDEDIIIYINKIVHTNKFILLIKLLKYKKKPLKYFKTTKKRMLLFEVNCNGM